MRLHTTIYVPQGAHTALPFIFLRTPYGIDDAPHRAFTGYLKALVEEGYIFVFQDIRGRFKSEGKFVMQRPPRRTAQTYVENIFQARDSDYRAATQRIYRSPRFPSSVVLPMGPP